MLIGMIACNESVKNEKPKVSSEIVQNTLLEKDMPYLEIKENQLKSSNGLSDKQKVQILYSTLKRGSKYIKQDTVTLMSHLTIISGDDINVSPLCYEYLEILVKQANDGIEWGLKTRDSIALANGLPLIKDKSSFLIDWAASSETMSNEGITDGSQWQVFMKAIEEYRQTK